MIQVGNWSENPVLTGEYPVNWIEEITLEDGAKVLLRPIRPDDAPRLQHGFSHLTAETIYMRFLETTKGLTDEQARYLATVDYQKRMAFVGTIIEDDEEHLVMVARYNMVEAEEEGLAEVAVIVRDDYQNRGLGTISIERLGRYAAAQGVKAFIGAVHVSNARILHFIRRSGLAYKKVMSEPGVWDIRIDLKPE